MMNTFKHLKNLSLIFFVLSTLSCSVTKLQKKGAVAPKRFHYETTFTTLKSLILLPANINGESKNFLFDTGAQLNLIQREKIVGKKGKYIGASNRKAVLGNEIIPSIQIGTINFTNTYALNGDLVGLKEQISNFGGIIGQSIISKANWLIDYPNKEIKISNENLADDTYETVRIKREGGSPYTYITINNKKYKIIIDLGSSSRGFNIPTNHPLAKEMLTTYKFTDNEREIYSLGGTQLVKEKIGILPKIKLGDIEFTDVPTEIRNSSQLRVGIRFFEDYTIYIDNNSGDYKIKKSNFK